MSQKTKKIILVEDDLAIADIYATIFKKAGIEVIVIGLGKDVLPKIKDEEIKPDIVLLDLILPDVNGMDVLKEIKGDSETKHIPVFILTNQKEEQSEKIGGVKPDKFIIKANITPTQLLELVKEQLKL